MTDILAIIQNGNGNIKLEVTGEDLLLFSNQLIS
ncbi:MAG: transcriptional regulator, partial [Phocaeicola sp.]